MPHCKAIRKFIFVVPAILLLIDLWFPMGEIPYIVLIISGLYVLISASACINSGVYLKALCNVKTKDKVVALSFDDGPTEATPMILELLKEHEIKAAFFCIGQRIIYNEEILKRIDREGHIIGNHSYSHKFWFDLYSSKRMIKELIETEDLIQKSIGKKTNLFRPPYGVTNPNLRKAVDAMSYITIGWSLRSKDTVITKQKRLLKRLKRKLKPGAVILFHDTNPQLKPVLEIFLKHLSDQAYQIVRLDELFKIKAYA